MRNFIQTAVNRVLNAKGIDKVVAFANGMVTRAQLLGARLHHAGSQVGGHLHQEYVLAAYALASADDAAPRASERLEPAFCGLQGPMPRSWRSTRRIGSRAFTQS